MTNIVLNETPVRTSRNFNINNVKLEDIEIPKNIQAFKNVKVSELSSKIALNTDFNNFELKYGLNDFLTEQVNNNANFKANIVIDSKTNKDVKIDFKFDEANKDLIDAINIVANEDTKSTIIVKYESDCNVQAYHNGIIKAVAKSNSVLNIIVVNFMNEVSNNFLSIENCFEKRF